MPRLFKVLTHISYSTERIVGHDNNGTVYFFPAIFRPHFSVRRIINSTHTHTHKRIDIAVFKSVLQC